MFSFRITCLAISVVATMSAARSIIELSPEGSVQGQTYTTKYIGKVMSGDSYKEINLESLRDSTIVARRTRCAEECFSVAWCRTFENLEDTFVCKLFGDICPEESQTDKFQVYNDAFISCPEFSRTTLLNADIPSQDTDAVVKEYYGDTIMTAAVVPGFQHIHSESEPVVLWKLDYRTLPNYVEELSGTAGSDMYPSVSEYANACGNACNAEASCIGFGFAYLPETDPNATECVWADQTTLYSATGYKETWDMRYGLYQMMITTNGTGACPEGQFLGYQEGGEVTYDVTKFGCNVQFGVNQMCAPEQTAVYDLSYDNSGCSAGLKCDYHPLDPNKYVGVCWNDTTLEADKAARVALLDEYSDMISNITVEGYGYVRSDERVDGLSRGLMAFSDNYTSTKDVPDLRGSTLYPTVIEFVAACTTACDTTCWGIAFVYKPEAMNENECRLLPNSVTFSMEYAQQFIKANGTVVPPETVLYAVYAKNNEKACTFDAFPGYNVNWKGMDDVGCHPVVPENERCVTVDVDLRANSTDGCDTGLECQDTANYERCLYPGYNQNTTAIAFESFYLDNNEVHVVIADASFSPEANVLATVDLSDLKDMTMQERWYQCAVECQNSVTCVSFANNELTYLCVLSDSNINGCDYVPKLDSCAVMTVASVGSYISQIDRF
ncbi:hypothetical protein SARC_13313 [Sphaeroforma arctica JP610]|uniref:Apple domain-containing protein n=1 Tax=Sphaeroforma arctica JP610 TaxID=667725 RepID=A0A0L0FBK9_9EUKA|nr:hypothetical protein SARC_13313 [Sphaeroforma arctica JP610]KNC74130.1 hypothetical protein SARC_13313 [Sphaeroforma arctica JP610]|eukprot:XP_014148032.1 hypothetical protein SARC_13313 [Sphaeroforma arctica JP610]